MVGRLENRYAWNGDVAPALEAGASEVWVNSTVKDLTAGSDLSYEDAGEHELKGPPTAGTSTRW